MQESCVAGAGGKRAGPWRGEVVEPMAVDRRAHVVPGGGGQADGRILKGDMASLARCGAWILVLGLTADARDLTCSRDIAPIVRLHCAPCHREGEAGPFPLQTYADVRKRGPQIVAVTRSGYMPPWLPQHGYGEFAGERRLTAEQIRDIADWVSQGGPQGNAEEAADATPLSTRWQLGTPDLVLEAASALSVPASGPDVYWNFVFRPAVPKTRWVRALEIRPGDRRLVHHANLPIDRGAANLRPADAAQGFPGMDLTILRSPFDPDGHFLFWKPGGTPRVEPDGFAWRLDQGDELVLNTHLHPSGKPEEVRPQVALYFTNQPATQFPLLLQLENDRKIDIPAGESYFVVTDDFRLPLEVSVLAVYPHAHYLGKLLEAWATLPDGSRKWLIRIPAWDPNWQGVYSYREPVVLPKGSVISMRYHYDNSAGNVRNPNHPPKRVLSGNQSVDEMGHLWLQVLPTGSGDRRRELQQALLQHRLDKDPTDFTANFNLGAVMLSRLNAAGAVSKLAAAVRIQPERAEARNMLGMALASVGRTVEAIEQYELALQGRPDFPGARFNLANALTRAERFEAALAEYRKVLAGAPADGALRNRVAGVLAPRAEQFSAQEKWAGAVAFYAESAGITPNDARLRNDFGVALWRLGKRTEALEQFDRALALDPDDKAAQENRAAFKGARR